MKTPKKGKVDTYFLGFDWHTDALHIPTYNIFRKHAARVPKKGRKAIIGGDFVDCLHLMLKDGEMKKAAKSVPKIEELIALSDLEFEWANKILDEMQKDFEEVTYLFGNHGHRYFKWLKYCPPEYAHHFDIVERLDLKKRKVKYVMYPDYLDIGDLSVTHGYKHGQNHNDEMMKINNCSILYGHVHHYNCKSYSHRGESKRATSSPTMSDTSPDYQLKRGENNWSNGYMVLNMRSDGLFNLYCFEVWKDKLVLPDGTILDGK